MKQKNPALDKLRTHLKKAGIIGRKTNWIKAKLKTSTELIKERKPQPPQSPEEKERERTLSEIPF